jgi:hypothetical protein
VFRLRVVAGALDSFRDVLWDDCHRRFPQSILSRGSTMNTDNWISLFFGRLTRESPFHWQRTIGLSGAMCHPSAAQLHVGLERLYELTPCVTGHDHPTYAAAFSCSVSAWYASTAFGRCSEHCGVVNTFSAYNARAPMFVLVNMLQHFDSGNPSVNWRNWLAAGQIHCPAQSLTYHVIGIISMEALSASLNHFTVRFQAANGEWWFYNDLSPVPARTPSPDMLPFNAFGTPVACVYKRV